MKITLFTLLFFIGLHSGQILAQTKTIPNSYEIVQNTLLSQEDFYKNAINKSNLENYRLKNDRVHLMFENGFVLELFSAKEIHIINKTIVVDSYVSEFPAIYKLPTFRILASGALVASYLKSGKH